MIHALTPRAAQRIKAPLQYRAEARAAPQREDRRARVALRAARTPPAVGRGHASLLVMPRRYPIASTATRNPSRFWSTHRRLLVPSSPKLASFWLQSSHRRDGGRIAPAWPFAHIAHQRRFSPSAPRQVACLFAQSSHLGLHPMGSENQLQLRTSWQALIAPKWQTS